MKRRGLPEWDELSLGEQEALDCAWRGVETPNSLAAGRLVEMGLLVNRVDGQALTDDGEHVILRRHGLFSSARRDARARR